MEGERALGEAVENFEALRKGTRRFLVLRGSATDLPLPSETVDLVVTDPPYMNNVQYHDLSAFFRVWLRRMLPGDPDWDQEFSGLTIESESGDPRRYAELLGLVFSECRRVLKKDRGRLAFTFHHWKPEAWAALTVALRRAGFRLLRFYVVHAENPASVHIAGQRALLHDAVLFAAPKEDGPFPDWRLPPSIDGSDSEEFVWLCAESVGAMLNMDMPEAEIWLVRRRLMGG